MIWLLAIVAVWLVAAGLVAIAIGRAADRRDARGKP